MILCRVRGEQRRWRKIILKSHNSANCGTFFFQKVSVKVIAANEKEIKGSGRKALYIERLLQKRSRRRWSSRRDEVTDRD